MFSSTWKFLSDHNVPNPLTVLLETNGQDIVRSKDVVGDEAKDPVVAKFAIDQRRILLSWDRDFGHQRFMKARFTGLSRIGFSYPEPLAVERFTQVADVVDFLIRRHKGLPPEIRIARDKVQLRDTIERN